MMAMLLGRAERQHRDPLGGIAICDLGNFGQSIWSQSRAGGMVVMHMVLSEIGT